MGPRFNLTFTEIRTCGSRKQCKGPSQKNADAQNPGSTAIQTHTNLRKIRLFFRHHCTIKVKKTCPHSNLDLRKVRKVFGQD